MQTREKEMKQIKAEVKILIEGYVSAEADGHSCSTIILVLDEEMKIVVDPGTLPDPMLLIKALKKEGLNINDINVVCITHSHMDHYRNIGMFPKAKALDFWGYWEGDVWKKCNGRISDNIKLIKTPGHSYDSITILVETGKGKIAICGDVFWKEKFPNSPSEDPYASDKKKLEESRKKVLKIADYVIPGHGNIFKNMFKAKK
jgi:glyoxylase-like metal-dependent hydrolase (beta-lactamase superfamily II)